MRESIGNHDVPLLIDQSISWNFYLKNIYTETETAAVEDSWYDTDVYVDFTSKRTTICDQEARV